MAEELNPVIQAFRQQQQSAQINATTSIDGGYDPEKAARAYQLEQQTGVPSNFIFNEGDVDEFETRRKSAAARELVRSNPYVEEYLNSHPMAGKISNDGLGSLDNISAKMDDYHGPASAPGTFTKFAAKDVLPIVGSLPAASYGWTVGAGIGAIGGPVGALAGGITGGLIGGMGGSYALSLAQDWLLEQVPDKTLKAFGMDKEQLRMDMAAHGTAAFLGSFAPFLLAMRPGKIPENVLRDGATALERVLNKPIAQRLLSGTAMAGLETGQELYQGEVDPSHIAMAGAFGAVAAKETTFGKAAMATGQKAATRMFPFLRSGMEPPIGLDPVIDKFKIAEAKERMEKLDALFDAAQADPTRERSADFFRNQYLKLFPDAKIEIDAQMAEKLLYGEGKRPEVGDNKLGWVPDIEQQWDTAVASGGRIEVPLNDWLAYADKENVAKVLHDHISTKRGGMTLEEAKAPAREDRDIEPSGDSAVDGVRKAAGLEPLFAEVREKKLNLLRKPIEETSEVGEHNFHIMDEKGDRVGELRLNESAAGKNLQIDWVGAGEVEAVTQLDSFIKQHANTFGLRTIRDLLNQLRQEFPNAETITGMRISGAREVSGKALEQGEVKINLRTPTREDLIRFAETIPGAPKGWDIAGGEYPFPEGELPLPPGAEIGPIPSPHIGIQYTAQYTVRQAIDNMDPGKLRGVPAALHQFFGNRLKELVGDVPIRLVTQQDMNALFKGKRDNTPGFYSPDDHAIVMVDAIIRGGFGKKYAAHWLMHEMGHALTARALLTDTRVTRDVMSLMKETKELMRVTSPNDLARFDYAFTKPTEFMAEAWGHREFQEALASLPMSPQLAEKLGLKEKTGTIWEAVRNIVGDVMQKLMGIRPENSLLDGMLKISEVINSKIEAEPALLEPGRRFMEGKELVKEAGQPPKQLELPEAGTTRIEDMLPFGKSFVGMTIKRTQAYIKAAKAKAKADFDFAFNKSLKEQTREESKEWKSNQAAMRGQIAEQVNNRPDIAADSLLRYGIHGDIKLPKPPKIDANTLTPEQIAVLPKDWVAKRGGVAADDIAGMFGYGSGEIMVQRLAELHADIKKNNVRRDTYIERTIDQETKQHMDAVYGDRSQNIITNAEDHALSQVEENFMHEQTQAIAEKAGLQYPIKREELKQAVVQDMADTKMGRLGKDKYLADAGRAGRAMEDAWQKEDYAEAFRQSQMQQLSFLRAREAAKYEKMQKPFDNRMDKFYKREVPGMDPGFTNFIHLMMTRLGKEIKQSLSDLTKEITKGDYKTLADFKDFWEGPQGGRRDLHIPDFLLDPAFSKPVEELTASEFAQVHRAFTAMEHVGRDVQRVWKEGNAADLGEVLREMVEKIKSLGAPRQYKIDREKSKVMEHVKSYWWSGINVETMLNRIDRDDPRGIMFKTIVNDYTKSSNSKEAMMKEYQKKLSAISVIPDMDKKVDNNLFVDRHTQEYFPMRKRNVLAILQNWGNASNRRKLAEGYGLKPDDIEAWLLKNTTKEDWDRAQKIGDLFKELFAKADNMSREISGVGIEGLELTPFTNPHGSFEGWYNPVKYDPYRPGSSKKLAGPEAELEQQYFRATTPQGYTKARTEYIAPMELNLDIVPIRMRQMIHDINLRPTIIQLSKIFYDQKFRDAMIGYYGKHQEATFIPFLNDLANSANFKSHAEYMGTTAMEYFRQNIIATLIGFNPSTVLKHGPTAAFNSLTQVGPINFLREFTGMMKDPSQWRMAMEKSEQLQRRWRAHFTALIKGHEAELHLSQHSIRDFLIGAGATPVSISDLITAVPTWLAAYKKALSKGETEGFSVALADRAVRFAHGDSALSNKPAIMRTNALGAWFSSLYGFFSHMQQRQYEMAWKAKDLLRDTYGKGSGDAEMATRHAPDLLKGFMSYIIFPALVEELVTPYLDSDKDSWGKKAGKSLAMGLSSSFVGVRDFTRGLINFRDPQAGLMGTSFKAFTDVSRDLTKKGPMNREQASNLIKHVPVLVGALTGLTNAQEGRSAEFMYRYSEGLEKPKGPWGALVGLRYGKIDKHSRTFDEWYNHLTGGH